MAKRSEFQIKSEILRNLATELMCHNCKNIPNPYANGKNRYQCTEHGQYLCEDCKNKSVCKTYSKPSPGIAKLLDDLPWFCCNFVNGCKGIMWEKHLKEHQRNCFYRLVSCPNIHAHSEKMIIFNRFSDHIEFSCPNFEQLTTSETKLQGYDEIWFLFPVKTDLCIEAGYWKKIEFDEKTFWFCMYLKRALPNQNCDDDQVIIFVKLAGCSADAKKFEFSIGAGESKEDDEKYAKIDRLFSHSVFSLDDNSCDIMTTYPELNVDIPTLKKYRYKKEEANETLICCKIKKIGKTENEDIDDTDSGCTD